MGDTRSEGRKKAFCAINFIGKAKELYQDNFLDAPNNDFNVFFAPTGKSWGRFYLEDMNNLQIIASNTTDDKHIDTEYCKEHGIEVITLAGDPVLYDITAVAEHTIGLIIMLTRNVLPAVKSVSRGTWDRYPFGGRKMLKNMTLGVVGRGRIGDMVDRLSVNMVDQVLYHDTLRVNDWGIEDILPYTDIVTAHIPAEGNEGMFDRALFEQFKDGAYFINTSRGEIVDEDALIWVLESGKLAGAATDVLNGEFQPGFKLEQNPLWRYAQNHDNLIITPHIGGSTEDAWEMTQVRIIEKVLEFLG